MAGGGKRREYRWRLEGKSSIDGTGKAGSHVFHMVVKRPEGQKRGDGEQPMGKFPRRVSVCLCSGRWNTTTSRDFNGSDVFLLVLGLEAGDQDAQVGSGRKLFPAPCCVFTGGAEP